MTHTLVAAFDSLGEAQAAKADLLSQHLLESDIQLSSAAADAPGHDTSATAHQHEHGDESLGHKISHFFSSLFGSDEDDKPHRYAVAYPEAYRRGATVLTVNVAADEHVETVADILERNGAIDIDERSAGWGAGGVAGHETTTHIAGTHLGADHAAVVDRATGVDRAVDSSALASTAIPVIEEDLRVGKREVNTGRVRVVSRVSERPVEETVNLHEEHAHVERRPVDRPATAGELNSFKAGSIEIQETAEEVVVEKTARVVEEVTVGK